MLFEKTFRVKVPREVVWNKVMDVPFMTSCMPGVERVEAIDDKTYRAVVKAKVSFISATFDIVITITDKRAPVHLETSAHGKGLLGVGELTQKQVLDLQAISETETEAIYKCELVMSGRLAAVGQRGINRKVEEIAEEFTKKFISAFEKGNPAAA